jgi:hypothetical protein
MATLLTHLGLTSLFGQRDPDPCAEPPLQNPYGAPPA